MKDGTTALAANSSFTSVWHRAEVLRALEALMCMGVGITAAAARCGISRWAAYRLLKTEADRQRAEDEALGPHAIERALEFDAAAALADEAAR